MAREQKTKPGFTSPDTIKDVQEMQLPSDRMATPEELAEQAAAADAISDSGKNGAAKVANNVGVQTKDKVTKAAAKSAKAKPRTIKVRANQKGWFDTKRKKAGDVFMVSEDEYSEIWMDKI